MSYRGGGPPRGGGRGGYSDRGGGSGYSNRGGGSGYSDRGGGGGGYRGRGGGGDRRGGYSRGGPVQPSEDLSRYEPSLPDEPLARGFNEREIKLQSKFYTRPGYGQKYKNYITLITNHYRLNVKNHQYAYHYDLDVKEFDEKSNDYVAVTVVQGEQDGRRKRRLEKERISEVLDQFIISEQKPDGLFSHNGKIIDPVTDRFKNLYSPAPLNIIGDDPSNEYTKRIKLKVDDNEKGIRIFEIQIKAASGDGEVCEISLQDITDYYEGQINDVPLHAITALNIILRYGPSKNRIQVGANSLYPKDIPGFPICSGKILKFGHYQSIRPIQNGLCVNIDRTATVFYPNGTLIDYLMKVFGVDSPQNIRFNQQFISFELKGVKFYTKYQGFKRNFKNFMNFGPSASRKAFSVDGQDITVQDYFRNNYKINLRYPDLPCVQFGENNFIPIELISFAENQPARGKLTGDETADVIKYTATAPKERFLRINKSAFEVNKESTKYLTEFTIDLGDLQPIRTNGKILIPPTVNYKDKKINPNNGKWNLSENIKLYSTVSVGKWIAVSFCKTPITDNGFVNNLYLMAKKMGLDMNPPAEQPLQFNPNSQMSQFAAKCRELKDLKFIVWLQRKDDDFYSKMKQYCQVSLGVECQCILEKTFSRANPQTLANIVLKINTKLGGINQMPDKPIKLRDEGVLIIGADVTHTAPADKLDTVLSKLQGDRFEASIAAVVANTYGDYFRFQAETIVQPKEKQELITDIGKLFTTLVQNYYKKNGNKLPQRIIYYRDGVSEGQFESVLQHELNKIKDTFSMISNKTKQKFNPKMTFIIVQKRHHTRFRPQFDEEAHGKHLNVPPGVLVDTTIVHPRDFDYFMVSHEGIQGTSCPTHYYVLADDNKFTPDEIYEMTFFLCHTYAKATRSISIPSPVMYAHLAAFKSRQFIQATTLKCIVQKRTERNETPEQRQQRFLPLVNELNTAITVKSGLKEKMYFC